MGISYGKITIYLLAFIGFVYADYSSYGFLTNLRDAVLSAKSIFGDITENVIFVGKKIGKLLEAFDASIEENCIFKCPNNVPPKQNRNHVPSANGCGSLGLNIKSDYLPISEMKKCCDTHDICYDTCNNDKEMCDMEFKRCLYRYCDSYERTVGGSTMIKACKGAAKMLFTGTLTLGCKSYIDAQSKACFCPTYGWKDERNYKYTRGDGEL